MKPKKRADISDAVGWIAFNDDNTEMDISVIREQLTVLMVADLFGREPQEIAEMVLWLRQKSYEEFEWD